MIKRTGLRLHKGEYSVIYFGGTPWKNHEDIINKAPTLRCFVSLISEGLNVSRILYSNGDCHCDLC